MISAKNNVSQPRTETLFDGSEEENFGHDVFTVNGKLTITASQGNKVKLRLRTLASSKNAITLSGAGNIGPLHNFDFTKPRTWDLITTTQGVEGFDEKAFDLSDTGFFQGMDPLKFTKSGGALKVALSGDKKKVVLVYEPKDPTANEIHFAMKTGDVALVDLKAIFGQNAHTFTRPPFEDGKWKAVSETDFATNGQFFVVPEVSNKPIVMNDQQSDRGFTGDFQITVSAVVDGITVTKTLFFRVDAGFSPIYLSDDVGYKDNNANTPATGLANKQIDVIQVQQRLRFFGIPARDPSIWNAPQGDTVAMKKYMNIGDIYTDKKEVNTDLFRLTAVDGIAPTGTSNNEFYQVIQLFNAIVAVAEPRSSNVVKADNGQDGGQTSDNLDEIALHFGDVPGNKSISKDGKTVQWLSASNAPFWVEFTDPDPESRTEFDPEEVTTRGEWGFKQKQDDSSLPYNQKNDQLEKWAASWTVNTMLLMARSVRQALIDHGNSPLGGGDAKPHSGHEAGLNIDIRNFWIEGNATRNDEASDVEVLRSIAKYGSNIFYYWSKIYNQVNAEKIKDASNNVIATLNKYSGLFVKEPHHKDRYHFDVRRPIISDLHFSGSNMAATFVDVSKHLNPESSPNNEMRIWDKNGNLLLWDTEGYVTPLRLRSKCRVG